MTTIPPVCVLLFLTCVVTAAHSASPTEEVIAADTRLNLLIIGHDSAEAEAYYASEFLLTTSSGKKKSKQNMLDEIGSGALVLEQNATSCVEVRAVGSTAVLTGVLHQKGTSRGAAFDVRLLVTDTWVRRPDGQGWLLLAGHATRIDENAPVCAPSRV